MTKKELLQLINNSNTSDDTEIVFPNQEYGGYEKVNRIQEMTLHKITQEGKKNYVETGCDFIDEKEYLERQEDYEKNTKVVIALML